MSKKEKIYIVEGLDCANCAAKIERKIQGMPQIDAASLTFATKQLKITAPHPDALLPQLEAACRSIEDGVTLTAKDGIKSTAPAAKQGIIRQNAADLASIAAGAILFAAGVILDHADRFPSFLLPIFIIAYLILGWEVLWTALKNIFRGQVFDENFLMSVATVAAFCIGDFAEGVGVMLFYRIGELFEHIAMEKSRSQIMEAVDMRPETVNLVLANEEHSTDGTHVHAHHDDCGCDHEHEHAHHDDCGCGHEHEHEHHDDCGCGHEHEHEHHDDCGCGHEHEHAHHDDCGCDHEHEHEHHHSDEGIRIIPAEEAKPGDILLIRPGDRIPLDGIVTEGISRIDTSPVTGEPVPAKAEPGSEVISGCVNTEGLLKIQVTRPLSESMVTRILDSVENAAASKPTIDRFITRFAKVYTPVVVALAVLTAIIPSLITGEWSFWITTAITFLVISCPCALVVSVPLAFFSGIGAASKLGILFKGGLSIEALKKVRGIVMDKTGTITKGTFTVQHIVPADSRPENELLALAAACEANSTHPIAASITEAAQQRALSIENPTALQELSGMGIKATLSAGTVLCGNSALMEHFNIAMDAASHSAGTEVFLALNGKYVGSIIISDTIKPDAVDAISRIKSDGLVPAMLTGDALDSAQAVATDAGIDRVFAQLMPEEKLTALRKLRSELGSVMFVGDGINDAPVLAGADVGAAMGTGADAAIEAADVVFMNGSVSAIPQSIHIAKATGRISTQNVVFALAIKFLVILLGFAGFANIWAAVFADTGVAMLCILNSLRILWKKF